jgi:glutamine cyclotransferase
VIAKVHLGADLESYLNKRPLVSLKDKGEVFVSVFNGIASDGRDLFLTGKYWDKIFRVALEPMDRQGKSPAKVRK